MYYFFAHIDEGLSVRQILHEHASPGRMDKTDSRGIIALIKRLNKLHFKIIFLRHQ